MIKLFILLIIASTLLSSCATSGYGCKGKASWNDVIRRANKPY